MKILVACEESQAVTIELRKLGHEAFSCDLMECSGGHPEWHLRQDVLLLLKQHWDRIIAFPPCTHIVGSGARHFAKKRADGRQQQGIDFFMKFTKPSCPWAIENPVGIMSTLYRKPDQIIQPYHFGHRESKRTCLWLHGLPELVSTDTRDSKGQRYSKTHYTNGHHGVPVWDNQTPSGQNKLGPSADRARIRSRTYPGIAKAMAQQWAGVCV